MDDSLVDKLKETLFPEDGECTYAVLDGASCEDLIDHLVEFEPEYCCLYAGELDPDMEEVAPYLVLLERDHPFTDWLLANILGKPWGVFAHSPADFRAMRKHFRTFLTVNSPEGERLYFRYYDPRVLSVYLPNTKEAERSTMFGPISTYFSEFENAFLCFKQSGTDLIKRREFDLVLSKQADASRY